MKVTYHVYRDVALSTGAASDEEAASRGGRRAAEIRRKRYSFVAMGYHARRRKLFLGATNAAGDVLVEFDPRTRRFRSCGYPASGLFTPATSKIHKGISVAEDDDQLFFGIATLSPLPKTIDTEGGLLVRYDIGERRFTRLAAPAHGHYHQATLLDPRRGLMYFYTDRACFGVYDLRRRRVRVFEAMESVTHNLAMDDAGGVWGTYGAHHAFFRYDPDSGRFEFPEGCAFPNAPAAANIMYPGAGPCDCILNSGDGFLYAATALGEVYRLDPKAGRLAYLGKPFVGRRLPAMAVDPDGWLYLAGGREQASTLARYSRQEQRFEVLGSVEAPDGKFLHYAHELCVIDGVVFIGETDNPWRSGYLWACEI